MKLTEPKLDKPLDQSPADSVAPFFWGNCYASELTKIMLGQQFQLAVSDNRACIRSHARNEIAIVAGGLSVGTQLTFI